jgi:TIR domain/SIR2-like domain
MIQDGTCVLFLGPGIELDTQDANRMPLTVKLAQILANRLGSPEEIASQDDLTHVAQIFQRHNDRLDLEMAVEDFYRGYAGQTTDVHRQLAALPFQLCIDITHGGFLGVALRAAGKSPVQDFYWLHKERAMSLAHITSDKPFLYNLFGSLDELDSLVITENDLLDFLVNVTRNTPPLPRTLLSRFSAPDTAFLFLGFGFRHWYLRILLHVLTVHSDRKNFSLALEDADFFAHPDRPKTVLFYHAQHRIQFRQASWQAFADELSQRFHDATPRRGATLEAQPVSEDTPTVFLCHCSADAEAVAEVSARLQELGVRTWVDRQNLRGGDRWHQILGKAIQEWVDYFVVLETPAMLARPESYYYLEIGEALERARRFRPGTKFIFPAQLKPCGRLEQLADLQRIDLTTPNGLEQLATEILHDWTRRRGSHQP